MFGPSAHPLRMTRPTDNLRSDHVVIAQAVDILAAMAVHVRGGGAFPARESAVRTLAEFSDLQKNAISHRGRAFRSLAPHLRELLT